MRRRPVRGYSCTSSVRTATARSAASRMSSRSSTPLAPRSVHDRSHRGRAPMTIHVEQGGRDVLALAKTIAANDFPVERQSIIGVDRESGRLLRLSPFPWKGNDTDPPVAKWGWLHVTTVPDQRDPRPETVGVEGETQMTAYVDPKEGWRLRWPFVRPHLRGSLEPLQELARERV